MEDAGFVISPPESVDSDEVGLRQLLELAAGSGGSEWAMLEIRSTRSGRTTSIRIGSPAEPAETMEIAIGIHHRATLTVAEGRMPAPHSIDLLSGCLARELQRRRLHTESSLLQSAANSADAAILIFGAAGNILFANNPADELISRQTEEDLTANFNGGPPQPLFRLLCDKAGECVGGPRTQRWHERLEISDGSELSCEIVVLPPTEGGDTRAVMAIIREMIGPPDQRVDDFAALHGLSPREREVVRLLVRGHSTTGLADRLGISPHTVRDHLKNVFRKTSNRSRSELLSALSGAVNPAPR